MFWRAETVCAISVSVWAREVFFADFRDAKCGGCARRASHGGTGAELQLRVRLLDELELLHLAAHRHREVGHETHVLRHLKRVAYSIPGARARIVFNLRV